MNILELFFFSAGKNWQLILLVLSVIISWLPDLSWRFLMVFTSSWDNDNFVHLAKKLNNLSLNATYVEILLDVFRTICLTTFVLHNDERAIILQFLWVYVSSSLSIIIALLHATIFDIHPILLPVMMLLFIWGFSKFTSIMFLVFFMMVDWLVLTYLSSPNLHNVTFLKWYDFLDCTSSIFFFPQDQFNTISVICN